MFFHYYEAFLDSMFVYILMFLIIWIVCTYFVQEIGKTVNTGQVSLREAQERGAAVLSQTSSHGRQLVNEELSMLTADFDGFKTDLENLAARLGSICREAINPFIINIMVFSLSYYTSFISI